MILTTYPQFRQHFSAPGALTALDGFPAWPGPDVSDGTISSTPSNLRLSGFDGTIKAITNNNNGSSVSATFLLPAGGVGPLIDYTKLPAGEPVFPIQITCNNFAGDAVFGVHDFVWYVSQRRDPGFYSQIGTTTLVEFIAAQQCLNVTMPVPKSGFILIDINTSSVAEIIGSFVATDFVTDYALSTVLKNVQIYCKRVSDGAIQYFSIYRRITSG